METNKKEIYLSPEAEVFEVKTEGVICLSGEIPATIDDIPWMEENL